MSGPDLKQCPCCGDWVAEDADWDCSCEANNNAENRRFFRELVIAVVKTNEYELVGNIVCRAQEIYEFTLKKEKELGL